MKLNSNQTFLMLSLFLVTSDNAPKEDFCVPANQGEWASEYDALREKGILDANFNLTAYGKFRCHAAQSEGVNLRKLAERNPNMAIAMLRESAAVIQEMAARNQEFSHNSYKLFANISADLAYICAPVDVQG